MPGMWCIVFNVLCVYAIKIVDSFLHWLSHAFSRLLKKTTRIGRILLNESIFLFTPIAVYACEFVCNITTVTDSQCTNNNDHVANIIFFHLSLPVQFYAHCWCIFFCMIFFLYLCHARLHFASFYQIFHEHIHTHAYTQNAHPMNCRIIKIMNITRKHPREQEQAEQMKRAGMMWIAWKL